MSSTLRLRGGRVIDPANGVDAVRDIGVRDGRIVELHPKEAVGEDIDASGCVVMAGGIDMHTHIGGGKVNLARMLLPEDHRLNRDPIALPTNPLELASCGHCAPGTLATGYRYAEMGYTAAFEPAMMHSNARHAHMEMGDTPILDHGAYVMLGNDELFLQLLAEGRDFQQIRDYAGWTINAAKAMGVKVVNPGGISAFKFNQRKLDVDEEHAHWRVTPRRIVHTLAKALHELGVPHPLHIHGSNLGVAGNIESTLATIDALEGLPAHLTHIQFHAYGTEGPKKFSSAAQRLADAVNANPNVSIDVGQIMFGQTVTASGDTMRQHANAGLANPRKWIGADIECDAGCGVVPFKYREQSYVNALQWAIGLEIFLLVKDPWRVVLTTDHPNGAPFTSYPHLIRLLTDKSFRDEQFAKLHPDVVAQSALGSITRELTLNEVAIMTRAGPAKLLGLKDRGQLGVGAAADIAVYREHANRETMFTAPEHVFKDGVRVARAGVITATPTGGTHFVEPAFDRGIEKLLAPYTEKHLSVSLRNAVIGHDELCRCCNGGRLLPTACFTTTAN
ncbi:formylmethanofuran dehydrogenase subunit A [Methylibium petroleiphilum]|uniref:Formylmethanofuran dehydrogenase, subunit A n=1 Tax=Methylibium petroleiphilum (strain ATCC BAA-1232 / LMG 22953 / PM1) TaxID=420662 RepID=A2SJ39_METPP|nr:formylmethanofuran dehydrogenase subunit A [Methylibium petroleiphilum]ABM95578.1 formylmethanofuran dehydrogenase, subunit A [Methylibium petroleiphilum PM1]